MFRLSRRPSAPCSSGCCLGSDRSCLYRYALTDALSFLLTYLLTDSPEWVFLHFGFFTHEFFYTCVFFSFSMQVPCIILLLGSFFCTRRLDTDRICCARWFIRVHALGRDRGLVSSSHRTLMMGLPPSLFSRPLPAQLRVPCAYRIPPFSGLISNIRFI